jgi:hypothetical protein
VYAPQRDIDETRASAPVPALGSGQAEEVALAAGLKPLVLQLLAPDEIESARDRFERAGVARAHRGRP